MSLQARALEQSSTFNLYLIDCKGVIFCRFCEKASVFKPEFTAKHRLFTIDSNGDLADFLKKAKDSFPSVVSHPHYGYLSELSSRTVSGPLQFKDDLGTNFEAFSHLALDLALSECEPHSCHLTHVKFNRYPWLSATLNLENCSDCLYKKDNKIVEEVQDYNSKYIPSWRPLEVSPEPACSSVFHIQLEKAWKRPFTPVCHCCKLRRIQRSSYCLGLAKLWTNFYTKPFCTCSFSCFGSF